MPFRCLITFATCMALGLTAWAPIGAQTNGATEQKAEDKPKLPEGFDPPREIPPEMLIDKPLITQEEVDEYTKSRKSPSLLSFRKALKLGDAEGAAGKEIAAGARQYVYRMTMKEERQNLDGIRKEIMLIIQLQAKGAARGKFLQELTDRAAELLDNNFYVRLNAILLLGQLDLQDGDTRKGIPPVAFTPAANPLLKVLTDDSQPDALKVAAVRGLSHITRHGTPDGALRFDIAEALVNEIQRTNIHWWYQMRLADGLGDVGIINDKQRRPFVVQALAVTMVNKQNSWLSRCEAAKALGQVPLDGGVDTKPIIYQMVVLGHQMAEAFNKAPDEFQWVRCYFSLYLAFKSANSMEKQRRAGLLEKMPGNAMATEAYGLLLPMIQHAINVRPAVAFKPTLVQELPKWLMSNEPQSQRINSQLPPIATPPTQTARNN